MSLLFPRRSLELERLDTEPLDPETAARVFQNLETINRWLGGVRATLRHFARFSKVWKSGEQIRILDWGTGGADVPRALARWARRRGHDLHIVGIDQDAVTAQCARRACRDYPEIEIVHADARSFTADPGSFDYAISSLTLHHLSPETIIDVLRSSDRLVKRGMVMNDLRRSWRAWAWIWILSRLCRWHSMVRHDGPLSVRRAYTKKELAGFAQAAGLPYLKTQAHFGHRLTLAGEKP
jgi:2-polyprenyl-3-methyl-5-hydroxy-6-metoxy-1,4-benzoquinol methylase